MIWDAGLIVAISVQVFGVLVSGAPKQLAAVVSA
jgi:hypothetical protein